MDQGSVVVLCRRSVRFATLIGHADMHHDLNYSGLIPTATTLIKVDQAPTVTGPILQHADPRSLQGGLDFFDCDLQ